jgi:hypothetical protein
MNVEDRVKAYCDAVQRDAGSETAVEQVLACLPPAETTRTGRVDQLRRWLSAMLGRPTALAARAGRRRPKRRRS